MSDKKLPTHDPNLLETSLRSAQTFYGYDQQLTQHDRQRLSSYFWNRMVIAPVFSVPVACGFIMLPIALKRRKIFFRPDRKYFFTQVFLGFVGLGVGQTLGAGLVSAYQRQKLQSSPAVLGAYNSLSPFPSQLGTQYFAMTAKNPKFIMKDPSTIDWQQNPLFPLFLVVNRDLVTELRHEEEARIENFRERQLEQRQRAIDRRAGAPPTELTGTSWDNVIRQNEAEARRSSPPSPSVPPTSPASSQPVSPPAQDSSSFGIWDDTKQPQDDFTDSEKKW